MSAAMVRRQAWGLVVVAALGGCAVQGVPECQVFTGDEPNGVPNYLAQFRRTAANAACGDPLAPMALGLARFGRSGGAGFELGLRPEVLAQLVHGQEQQLSFDPTNDCRYPEQGCAACVRNGPLTANFCQERLDPVTRDVADGGVERLLTLRTSLPRFPDDAGVCRPQDAVQRLELVGRRLTLLDGGAVDVPALTLSWAWSELALRMTSAAPGSILTGKLERTHGACVERYDVRAIWPMTYCLTDVDCIPTRVEALLADGKQLAGYPGPDGGLWVGDAGQLTYWAVSRGALVYGVAKAVADAGLLRFEDGRQVALDGRGLVLKVDGGLQEASVAANFALSPTLLPVCDVDLGVCVPTADLEAR